MSDSPQPGKVQIKKWAPHTVPMVVHDSYFVPDPAKFAKACILKLQLEVLGKGCGCRCAAQLIDILKSLGCEVEIEGGAPSENPYSRN